MLIINHNVVTTFAAWLFLLLAAPVYAAAPGDELNAPSPLPEVDTSSDTPVPMNSYAQLELLMRITENSRQELAKLRQELQKSKDEHDRKRISEGIEALALEVEQLQYTMEKVATGGADLELFGQRTQGEFNWKQDIEDVFQPIVIELRRWTERPRKIERLRTERAYLEQRLPVAEAALSNIARLKGDLATPSPVRKELDKLNERWKKRQDEITSRLQLVDFELQNLLEPAPETNRPSSSALKSFFAGRVADILLALVAMAAVYLIVHLIHHAYSRALARRKQPRGLFTRLISIFMRILAFALGILAAMSVLYMRGDWIILGLLIIMLIGAAWAIKQSGPRYYNEMRTFLNMGDVREGERVIYNGLAWQVGSLNLFTILHNPMLRGGTLRLSLKEIGELQSRPSHNDEPWFPSAENDFVLLEDETFGRILVQTPELVQIAVGGAVKTYPVHAYLDQHPRNLSRSGFAVATKFGVDYSLQREIEGVKDRLKAYLDSNLRSHPMGAHLKETVVDFDSAGASSLDFILVAIFNGVAAENYFLAQRLLQRFALDASNEFGWEIPFQTVTVLTKPVSAAQN